MTNNKNIESIINKLDDDSFGKGYQFNYDKDKFIELSSSLIYYLKSFSSLKRYLEYTFLVLKHLIKQDFSLLIPIDEEGEIWLENIYSTDNPELKNINFEILNFCSSENLLNNFKIKNIYILDNFLKNKFFKYHMDSHKIISRGKCRGFMYIFHKDRKTSDSFTNERIQSFLINLLAVAIENYLLLKTNKKHENIDREISSGAEIQSRLLPDFCPKIFGVDLAAHCRPALKLGGDYYDFMSIKPNLEEKRRQKGRWALVIGDVMGKGIPAGLLMTMLRGMLRAEVLTGLPPNRILQDLNQLAIYDLDQSHRFVTLFYSDYDPRTKKLRYSNAAHNPPLLWKHSEQRIIKLDEKGFVIGLEKDADYHCGEVQLNNSDVILYYTDGVTEASNSSGDRFEEENLIFYFIQFCKKGYNAKEILNAIFKTLEKYSGEKRQFDDDASIVIFKLDN